MFIPDHYIELERIYLATLANKVRSLAVTATRPGEGSSTLVRALARRNTIAGRSTLLVDLNLHSPHLSQALGAEVTTKSPDQLSTPYTLTTNTDTKVALVVGPTQRKLIMKLREPGILEEQITSWLTEFDSVIIDTSPVSLNNGGNLPGEFAASACDGTILTILAGQTTETCLKNTLEKLNKAGGLLTGTVLNDQFNPGLKDELLREIKKINRYFPKVARLLRRWLDKSYLLSLEV